jgi:hypothetical protein
LRKQNPAVPDNKEFAAAIAPRPGQSRFPASALIV